MSLEETLERNLQTLLIVGRFENNSDLMIMDLASGSLKTDVTPAIMKRKMAVSGATSVWVDNETLMLIGGTEPPLGEGGRSIFVYTSKEITMNECLAAEFCLWEGDRNMDGTMVICDECDLSIHKYCDKRIRNLRKLPEKYFCPKCTKKNTNNQRKGRKSKKSS